MRVLILGSAAGGGVPQWNCGCPQCAEARARGAGRTQSSVAVSADGERWVLLNVSPDVRQQMAAHPPLWPRGARGSPVAAVVLTDAEVDHTLGLVLLREGPRLPVYAPAGVAGLLEADWPVLRLLGAWAGVDLRPLPLDGPVSLADSAGGALGLECRAVALGRRPPRYARAEPAEATAAGLRLRDPRTGGVLAYVPAAAAIDGAVRALADGADLLLFDGTFWSDDEMAAVGAPERTARSMGHVPVGGPDGSLAELPRLGARRVVLVHVNNTNPILRSGSPERAQVEAAGVLVAEDGMAFQL
jgi:pyrroloquinoline quinone biosynthesis protein B